MASSARTETCDAVSTPVPVPPVATITGTSSVTASTTLPCPPCNARHLGGGIYPDTPPAIVELLRDFDEATFVTKKLAVTKAQRDAIACEPQGTARWKEYRYFRQSASKVSAAAGHLGAGERDALLKNMVWPEYSALEGIAVHCAAYGTALEPVARDVYYVDRIRRAGGDPTAVRILQTGVLIDTENPWLAASPDFIIIERRGSFRGSAPAASPSSSLTSGVPNDGSTSVPPSPTNVHHLHGPYRIHHDNAADMVQRSGLCPHPEYVPGEASINGDVTVGPPEWEAYLDHPEYDVCFGEIKAPATGRHYSASADHAKHGFPTMYHDQMWAQKMVGRFPGPGDAVTYTPANTEVTRFHFRNTEYWTEDLFPAIKALYFGQFLRLLRLRVEGRLRPGEIVVRATLCKSLPPPPSLPGAPAASKHGPLAVPRLTVPFSATSASKKRLAGLPGTTMGPRPSSNAGAGRARKQPCVRPHDAPPLEDDEDPDAPYIVMTVSESEPPSAPVL